MSDPKAVVILFSFCCRHEIGFEMYSTVSTSVISTNFPLTLGRKNRICCFGGLKIVTSKRRESTCPPQGEHYRNGNGTGEGTRRFPQAFSELFPETKGMHTAATEILSKIKIFRPKPQCRAFRKNSSGIVHSTMLVQILSFSGS